MPPDPNVGEEARDLIRGLICDPEDRLTADAIRKHPFFKGLDFKKLRSMEPPIKPVVNGPLDTSNFDDFGGADNHFEIPRQRNRVTGDKNSFAFHDYGYDRSLEAKKPSSSAALSSALSSPAPAASVSVTAPSISLSSPVRAPRVSGGSPHGVVAGGASMTTSPSIHPASAPVSPWSAGVLPMSPVHHWPAGTSPYTGVATGLGIPAAAAPAQVPQAMGSAKAATGPRPAYVSSQPMSPQGQNGRFAQVPLSPQSASLTSCLAQAPLNGPQVYMQRPAHQPGPL